MKKTKLEQAAERLGRNFAARTPGMGYPMNEFIVAELILEEIAKPIREQLTRQVRAAYREGFIDSGKWFSERECWQESDAKTKLERSKP